MWGALVERGSKEEPRDSTQQKGFLTRRDASQPQSLEANSEGGDKKVGPRRENRASLCAGSYGKLVGTRETPSQSS